MCAIFTTLIVLTAITVFTVHNVGKDYLLIAAHLCHVAYADGNSRLNGLHNNPLAHPYPNQAPPAGPQHQSPPQQQVCCMAVYCMFCHQVCLT